jgi:hypothetical protein
MLFFQRASAIARSLKNSRIRSRNEIESRRRFDTLQKLASARRFLALEVLGPNYGLPFCGTASPTREHLPPTLSEYHRSNVLGVVRDPYHFSFGYTHRLRACVKQQH